MQYSLRPYQQQASDSAVRYLENKAVTTGEGLPFTPEGVDRLIPHLDELRALLLAKDAIIQQQQEHIAKLTLALTRRG